MVERNYLSNEQICMIGLSIVDLAFQMLDGSKDCAMLTFVGTLTKIGSS